MSVRSSGKLTVDDYRALPEPGPQYQLIDGEFFEMSPGPNSWHQRFIWRLGPRMERYVEDHKLGIVLGAPIDVYLSRFDVLQPDLLFLSNARRDRLVKEGLHGAPDLVVEGLSPSTRKLDLGKKREKYALHGVIELLLADIDAETIAVYQLQNDADRPARTIGRGDVLSSDLLPGFTADVAELFAR